MDDIAREETNWQEQVALAVNASGDDWKAVVSGALEWLRDKPEEAVRAFVRSTFARPVSSNRYSSVKFGGVETMVSASMNFVFVIVIGWRGV